MLSSAGTITNALTIDVEDYFQVSAFSSYISRSEWDLASCRVERNIEFIIKILNENNAKATFFTLGWIAERYPNLIRTIVKEGHELASHGYGHERVTGLSRQNFDLDISVSKKILEDISGVEVLGYRAPSFSIDKSNFWAFDSLLDAGYKYSSSIFPISHDHYGVPNFPRFPCVVGNGILEIPISTFRIFKRNFPASGGGYFRLLPYGISKFLFKNANLKKNKPFIFYFHPWEIDFDQPKVSGASAKAKFRHYVNLNKMPEKLGKLLGDFKWGRVDDIYLNGNYTKFIL